MSGYLIRVAERATGRLPAPALLPPALGSAAPEPHALPETGSAPVARAAEPHPDRVEPVHRDRPGTRPVAPRPYDAPAPAPEPRADPPPPTTVEPSPAEIAPPAAPVTLQPPELPAPDTALPRPSSNRVLPASRAAEAPKLGPAHILQPPEATGRRSAPSPAPDPVRRTVAADAPLTSAREAPPRGLEAAPDAPTHTGERDRIDPVPELPRPAAQARAHTPAPSAAVAPPAHLEPPVIAHHAPAPAAAAPPALHIGRIDVEVIADSVRPAAPARRPRAPRVAAGATAPRRATGHGFGQR